MHRTLIVALVIFSSVIAIAVTDSQAPAAGSLLGFALTTKDLRAQKNLEDGIVLYENLQSTRSLDALRKAAKLDQNFALAHLFVAHVTIDPAERITEFRKAELLSPKASPDEQLLISWWVEQSKNHLVPAIASMNELVNRHPKNQRLLFYSAIFFSDLQAQDRSIEMCERSLEVDPNYGPALNQLGYEYSFDRQADKAVPLMERYIQLLPDEPNPQDSYAEILRMGGRFDQALEHYKKALAIDPKFDSSQVGIADTLQLMGKFEDARKNYQLAIGMVADEPTKLLYTERAAQSYYRAGDFVAADNAYRALAQRAAKDRMTATQAQTLRTMALYQKADAEAFKLLDEAEATLAGGVISGADREATLAVILRDRAIRASMTGKTSVAEQSVAKLKTMAGASPNTLVQKAFHVANGALLLSQNKNAAAAEELQEDNANCLALKLLVKASPKAEADEAQKKLAAIEEVTMEQAVTR